MGSAVRPYFDGSAFADLPRKGVPLDIFYLPLHENWPSSMERITTVTTGRRAFRPNTAKRSSRPRGFAEHCNGKRWNDTLFQCFFNNKYYSRAERLVGLLAVALMSQATSGLLGATFLWPAFHEGVARARGPAKLTFRCDISRPQWQRDTFDGLLDYNVEGSAIRQYPRLVFDRKEANGELVVEYGTTNSVEAANVQPVGWSLDTWALGSDGVLPWQTIGRAGSWQQADTLSLFYPGPGGDQEPAPSVRLKAFRRGQQDVEYLTLWTQLQKQPRWAVGQSVRRELRLLAERKDSGLGAPKMPECSITTGFGRRTSGPCDCALARHCPRPVRNRNANSWTYAHRRAIRRSCHPATPVRCRACRARSTGRAASRGPLVQKFLDAGGVVRLVQLDAVNAGPQRLRGRRDDPVGSQEVVQLVR